MHSVNEHFNEPNIVELRKYSRNAPKNDPIYSIALLSMCNVGLFLHEKVIYERTFWNAAVESRILAFRLSIWLSFEVRYRSALVMRNYSAQGAPRSVMIFVITALQFVQLTISP